MLLSRHLGLSQAWLSTVEQILLFPPSDRSLDLAHILIGGSLWRCVSKIIGYWFMMRITGMVTPLLRSMGEAWVSVEHLRLFFADCAPKRADIPFPVGIRSLKMARMHTSSRCIMHMCQGRSFFVREIVVWLLPFAQFAFHKNWLYCYHEWHTGYWWSTQAPQGMVSWYAVEDSSLFPAKMQRVLLSILYGSVVSVSIESVGFSQFWGLQSLLPMQMFGCRSCLANPLFQNSRLLNSDSLRGSVFCRFQPCGYRCLL